jgi:hypothetical protein
MLEHPLALMLQGAISMNIYPSTKAMPYVYMCTHKETGNFYIGYRESNRLPSHLDFPFYKTSSTIVSNNFDNYDWIIIAEFFRGNDAYDAEQQLIFENWNSPLLLNKSCFFNKKRFKCESISDSHKQSIRTAQTGKVLSEDTKEKIRKKRLLQVTTDETKDKISKSLVGNSRSKKPRSENTKQKIKESLAKTYQEKPKVLGMLGKTHSEETKEKMRLAHQLRKKDIKNQL